MNENIENKITTLFKVSKCRTIIGITKDNTRIKLRLFQNGSGDICYFRKGSPKRGYRLFSDCSLDLLDVIPVVYRKPTCKKWEDGWKKVKSKLEASGLWKNLVEEIDIALDIGYEKMQLASSKYWEIRSDDERLKFMKQLDERLIDINDEKKEYIISSLIWSYSKCAKVKKMYFGKYITKGVLERIQKAMQDKKKLHEDERAGYDVSFEFNPEKKKAWYSEEYRGCGNGHYYLALNSTHALFYEDD